MLSAPTISHVINPKLDLYKQTLIQLCISITLLIYFSGQVWTSVQVVRQNPSLAAAGRDGRDSVQPQAVRHLRSAGGVGVSRVLRESPPGPGRDSLLRGVSPENPPTQTQETQAGEAGEARGLV